MEGWRVNLNNEELCSTHEFFDVEVGLALIVQDNGKFPGVIAIYGVGGDYDIIFGGHDTPIGDETKGALRDVDVHAGDNFICLAGFDGDLFNTVEFILCRVLRGFCGCSCFGLLLH